MVALKQNVEFQAKMIIQMDKRCKEIWLRVDSLINKANRLSNKYDKGLGVNVQARRYESVRKDNQNNDGYFSPENIDLACTIKGRKEGTIERREWTSGKLWGTCVIWCKGFPF